MFDIQVNTEQIQYVETLLKTVNFGRRGDADGNYYQQRTGIIGQVVVADALGYERPKGDGFDKGVDLIICGTTIDVKTMGRTVPMKDHYAHNFMGSQAHFNTEAYLFTSLNINKNILTICGWLPKKEFLETSAFYKCGEKRYRDDKTYFRVRGRAGMYEIAQFLLNPLSSFDEFRDEIKQHFNKTISA